MVITIKKESDSSNLLFLAIKLFGKCKDQKEGREVKADRNSNVGTLNRCSTAHIMVKYWPGKLI